MADVKQGEQRPKVPPVVDRSTFHVELDALRIRRRDSPVDGVLLENGLQTVGEDAGGSRR